MKNNINVFVISKGRWGSIPKHYDLSNWFFVVPKNEIEHYRELGCKNVIEDGGGLVNARNIALDYEQHKYCLQLSDDAGKCFVGKKETSLAEVIELQLNIAERYSFPLLGICPVFNSFYQSNKISNGFVIGDFTLTEPNFKPRYDTKLKLKEDYDLSCKSIATYGVAARNYNVIIDFKHYKNKGGAVDYRTDSLEKETCEYLLKKFPLLLKPNVKRKNELLLKCKKN